MIESLKVFEFELKLNHAQLSGHKRPSNIEFSKSLLVKRSCAEPCFIKINCQGKSFVHVRFWTCYK